MLNLTLNEQKQILSQIRVVGAFDCQVHKDIELGQKLYALCNVFKCWF